MFPATGKIRCGVRRPQSDQRWWMVLDCDTQEISRYYRHLYWLDHSKQTKLQRPYWPAHVTVVRNEEPPNKALWHSFAGEEVEFHYLPGVDTNFSPERFRSFYWVNVVCPRFEEIRVELGLPKNSDGIYHMTIGAIEVPANRYTDPWCNRSTGNETVLHSEHEG